MKKGRYNFASLVY